MNFDLPSLQPFEPIVEELLPLIFERGIEELKKAGDIRNPSELKAALDDPSVRHRFFRGCHYGWHLAQGRIAKLVIEYQEVILVSNENLKEARRRHNQDKINQLQEDTACLANRQLVLRRLADTIFYHLIRDERWIARHISTDHRIHDIDTRTLARTIDFASDLNKQDRRVFHLVSDLTTVVHIGDLVRNDLTSNPPGWSLIELKDGRMNSILLEELEKHGGELEARAIEEIKEKYGEKAVSQAKRIERQRQRQENFMQLYETDTGKDPMHQLPLTFASNVVQVDSYATELPGLCERAAKNGVAIAVVNDCFRVITITIDELARIGRGGLSHIFYHLGSDNRECKFAQDNEQEAKQELARLRAIPPFFNLVRMNLRAMWPPPLFLWPVPLGRTLDLLFGRLLLFAQLDFEAFFEMSHAEGIEMRWARDKEVDLPQLSFRIPGSPNSRAVIARLTGDDETHDRSLTLFDGFFGRLFHEMMSPRQLLQLVRQSLTDDLPKKGWLDRSDLPIRRK